MPTTRWWGLAATVVLAGAGAGEAEAQSRIYDAFDLATPEAAVEEFLDAYADNDFIAVYMLLDPVARHRMVMATQMFEFHKFIESTDPFDQSAYGAVEDALDPEAPWLSADPHVFFDYFLSAADAEGQHLIDFPPPGDTLRFLGGEAVTVGDRDGWRVDAAIAGVGDVQFRLLQSPLGLWRMETVTARPGAENEVRFLPGEE